MKFLVKIGPGGITYDSSTGQVRGQEIRSFFRMAPGITKKSDEGIIETLKGLAVDWEIVSETEVVQQPVSEPEPEEVPDPEPEPEPEPEVEKPKKKSRWSSRSKDDEE